MYLDVNDLYGWQCVYVYLIVNLNGEIKKIGKFDINSVGKNNSIG